MIYNEITEVAGTVCIGKMGYRLFAYIMQQQKEQLYSYFGSFGITILPHHCKTMFIEGFLGSLSSGSCMLNNCRIRLMMFVDDIVLMADSVKALQESINRWEEFCRNWDLLTINIEKQE